MNDKIIENWLELRDIVELAKPEELRLRKLIVADLPVGENKFTYKDTVYTFTVNNTLQVKDMDAFLSIYDQLSNKTKKNFSIRAEVRTKKFTDSCAKKDKAILDKLVEDKVLQPYTPPPSVRVTTLSRTIGKR